MKNWRKIIASLLAIAAILSLGTVSAFAATKVNVSTGSYYAIKNVGSGKYLNVYGNRNRNNANVDIYAKDGTSGQDFKFTRINSAKNSYTLTPRCATGRRLNVYGESAYNKANVCLWSKTNDSTQCWIPEAVSGGYILRCADNTNYVLTATGRSNSANVNIQRYSSGNKYQLWTCGAFSVSSTPSAGNSASTSSTSTANAKMISINWNLIKKTGRQTYSGPCFCYSLAYARDILDGKAHQWQEYVADGTTYSADRRKASLTSVKTYSKLAALKGIYSEIESGEPVVICVNGSPEHYVCVVGYTNVTNTDKLTESNFLIIDPNNPLNHGKNTPQNLSSAGYRLYNDGAGYYYCYKK